MDIKPLTHRYNLKTSRLHINGKPFFKSVGEYRLIINPQKQSMENGVELILTREEYERLRVLIKMLTKPVKFSFYKKYEGMPRKNIPCKMVSISGIPEGWRLKFELKRI